MSLLLLVPYAHSDILFSLFISSKAIATGFLNLVFIKGLAPESNCFAS